MTYSREANTKATQSLETEHALIIRLVGLRDEVLMPFFDSQEFSLG